MGFVHFHPVTIVSIDFGRNEPGPKRLTSKMGRNDPPRPKLPTLKNWLNRPRPKRNRSETTLIRYKLLNLIQHSFKTSDIFINPCEKAVTLSCADCCRFTFF